MKLLFSRGDLDHLALDQLGHVFEAEHLVERVVERAQVRVDLLGQVAGQKAQLLAGFHRRTHQQDASHLLALQGIDRAGHGQVGLAGTGRADAEVDVVAQDLFDVALLVQAARANHAFLGAQRDAGFGYRVIGQVLHGGFLQVQVHRFRRQLATFGFPVEAAQKVFCRGGVLGFTNQLELIAAVADLDAQALFDQAQVLVELSAQIGETASLKGLEEKTMWFYGCVQGRF
eukprot:gene1308-1502_t